MGTHRRPKPPSRPRIAVLAATAGAISLLPTQSHAEPKPSVDEVRQQVEALYEEAEAPTEEYNSSLEQQKTLQAAADRAQEQTAKQQQEINELRREMGPLAAAQYRSGGLDPAVQLFLSGDPDGFLDRASTLDRIGARQVSLLSGLEAKQRILAQTRTEAAEKLAEVEKTRKELGAKKQDIQGKLTKAQKLLNSLTATERAELAAVEAKADKATGSSDRTTTYKGPASGRGRTALEFAYAQLGKPYQWGATGPNSYDCSGLTGAAWRAAGVSLPRTTQQQYAAGRKVAKSDLQPGDIIYWYSDLRHNGMYIGDGKIIHAPRTGKNIEITGLDTMPFFGATRP